MTTTIMAGDTAREFSDTLTLNSLPVDLTGASVLFVLVNQATGAVSYAAATIGDDPTTGDVSYAPTEAMLETPGRYRQEWHVELANGKTLTLPTRGGTTGSNWVLIHPKIETT